MLSVQWALSNNRTADSQAMKTSTHYILGMFRTLSMAGTENASPTMDDAEEEEEFDPIGTMALILLYFAILTIAWVYIYFVEFLGRDLVVIG